MAAQKKVAKKKATAKKATARKTTAKKSTAKKASKKKAPAKAATASAGQIQVTLLRSRHGRLDKHQACLAGLGLRRINQTVTVQDTPAVRGMINKVQYLLKVEEA